MDVLVFFSGTYDLDYGVRLSRLGIATNQRLCLSERMMIISFTETSKDPLEDKQ